MVLCAISVRSRRLARGVSACARPPAFRFRLLTPRAVFPLRPGPLESPLVFGRRPSPPRWRPPRTSPYPACTRRRSRRRSRPRSRSTPRTASGASSPTHSTQTTLRGWPAQEARMPSRTSAQSSTLRPPRAANPLPRSTNPDPVRRSNPNPSTSMHYPHRARACPRPTPVPPTPVRRSRRLRPVCSDSRRFTLPPRPSVHRTRLLLRHPSTPSRAWRRA